MTEFRVQQGDILDVPSDLLVLKHAQAFYGADAAVAQRLTSRNLCQERELRPQPGECVIIDTQGCMPAKRVMFLGTAPLGAFTYGEMPGFARKAIEGLANLQPPVRTITTTVHGTGYGLDGGESLQQLVLGFREGLRRHRTCVERITFLTLGSREARMLAGALAAADAADSSADRLERALPALPDDGGAARDGRLPSKPPQIAPGRQAAAVEKVRVFVAMPFAEEFENVYEFGIYPAVRGCGYVCERVDYALFTGDILARIREGIEAASLVIADLTEARPNVYLEVGYALGKGTPVICVAKKGEKLHFDVSTHRCLFYGKFTEFAQELEKLIRGVLGAPFAGAPSQPRHVEGR